MPDDGFHYREIAICELLGLPRPKVKAARDLLQPGTDYLKKTGKPIAYTEDGVGLLLTVLAAEIVENEPESWKQEHLPKILAEACLTPSDGDPGHKKDASVHTLIFERTYQNPHIIGATLDGQLCRVRVRDNRHFVKGMELPCRHIQADLYELARKCPRFRGRW